MCPTQLPEGELDNAVEYSEENDEKSSAGCGEIFTVASLLPISEDSGDNRQGEEP